MTRTLAVSLVAATTVSIAAAAQAASSDASQIQQNWQAFFSSSTPLNKRVKLLQDGKALKEAIEQNEASPMAKATETRIEHIQVNGQQADVTFDVNLNGQPALTNVAGSAVKEHGTWKVSRETFCHLASMSPTPPPACGQCR